MQPLSASFSHLSKVWFAATVSVFLLTGRAELGLHPYLTEFGWFIGFYCLAFLAYALLLREPDHARAFRMGITLAVLARVAMVAGFPNMSDDVYRYIWDGRLWLQGANPMDMLPTAWLQQLSPAERAEGWQFLYDKLNSQEYHSVYPPVLQGVFALAAWVSRGDALGAVLAMKGVILVSEVGSLWLLTKIAKRLNLGRKAVLVYALNPLVINEFMGNCHFEALMVFLFLGAFWLLMKWGPVVAAPVLALAIGTKLLPVLVFPSLVRRLGWGRTLVFGLLTALCCVPLFWYMVEGDRAAHFRESLRLYFQHFEFNGGLYYGLRPLLGYWANRLLPWLLLGLIVVAAWRERNRVWSGLPAAFMLALTLYQLHSPVLHPWYIAPVVALAALSPYRYVVLWTALLPWTYIAYYIPGIHEPWWVLTGEYLLLAVYMAYEWVFRREKLTLTGWVLRHPWLRRQAQRSIPPRLKIKLGRISRHLRPGESVLDLGSGHGGLCLALREQGLEVHPVDVVDHSFFPEVKPTLYDGKVLPFADGQFDVTLLVTVLHHTPDPDAVLREAKRVTRGRIVVMEDIYSNTLQKHLTYFTDSLVNLEFEGHPHTNRTDAEWLATFERLGLRVVYREDFRTLGLFRQVVYVVTV